MSFNFTIKHYRSTIQSYLDSEYKFCNLQDDLNKNYKNKIIMVHDVDHDISLCSNFMKAEKDLKVKATYFLRLHAKSYNMLSSKSIDLAKRIIDNGGDIGLHYEPSFCPTEAITYDQHISQEMEILSTYIGKQISIYNLHEPTRTGKNLVSCLPEKNRCYNSQHLKDYKYLSDSSCRWREGCFSEHINRWSKILVLTHPIWWYNMCPSENY